MDTFVAPTTRRRIDVTGDDRVRYLEDVSSQHLEDLPVTHVRSALVLDGKGLPSAMFDVVALGDRLALLVPDAEVAATVTDVLGMRTFLLDARFEARDDVVVAVRGDDVATVISRAGLTVVEGRCRAAGDLLLVSVAGGIDISGPEGAVRDAVAGLVEAGAEEGTAEHLEAWRVAAGIPAWGREVAAPHLPEEMGVLPSHVHLAKGCYPGQEAVARMWMLGKPRRRLAVVDVDGDVAPGWTTGEGRRTYEVTSASPAGDVALAFVPADASPGDAVSGEGASVTVRRIVGDDPVPPGHDPSVPRRRDKRSA